MLSSSATADSAREAEDAPPPLIPLLPDDLAVNCLARVSRFSHPTLSVVSKTVRSLIASPLYYSIRSNIGPSEPFLYVSLRHPTSPTMRWYTLFRSTRPSAAEKKPGNFLIPIPSIPSPSFIGSVSVSVGYEIYVIGGSFSDVPSSHVWVLDCRFHTWRRAPNMHIGREFAAAGVIDGRIYVIGGCVVDNWSRSTYWAESFDTKTQKWEPVPSPGVETREKWMHTSAVMQGKLYAMADRNGVVYEPREGKWELPEKRLNLGWRGRACVIDDILYCYDYLGKIRGYDPKSRVWLELRKGTGSLPKFLCGATMANLGGKLVVLWEQGAGGGGKGRDIEILCAEIDVEKLEEGQIWGRILWSDVVLRVPNSSSIVNCLSLTF